MLGTKTDISHEEAAKLSYINCVFKESLRKFPPVTQIVRYVTDELTINGHKVPANTKYALSTYVCSRLESNFSNPLEFKPERFLKDSQDAKESK